MKIWITYLNSQKEQKELTNINVFSFSTRGIFENTLIAIAKDGLRIKEFQVASIEVEEE